MRIERPVPGLQIEQQPAWVLHRMLLCGEARGEQDAEGRLESVAMAAVAHVPLNRRAKKRWGTWTLDRIILEPWAFSCFNANDPNRARLLDLWKDDPTSWERADTVCDLLESGWLIDPSKGATHYCTTNLWNNETPVGHQLQWYHRIEIEAGRTRETARHGHHVFAVAP